MSSEKAKQPPTRPPPPAGHATTTPSSPYPPQAPPQQAPPPSYAPPAGPYGPAAVQPSGPAGVHITYTGASQFPPLPREAGVVEHALRQQGPSLQARADKALGQHVPLVVNLDAMLACCQSPQTRLFVIENVFQRALPKFVEALEEACADELVRADIQARIGGGVELQNTCAKPPTKGTSLLENRLVYMGTFEAVAGFFTTKEWKDFFEANFYAKERYLLGRLRNEVVPALQHQLDSRFKRHVPIVFDPYAIVSPLVGRERLETARLLSEDAGFERVGRKFAQSVDSWFGSKPDPQNKDPVRSQNVLLPLVTAVCECIDADPSNPTLAKLSAIEVRSCVDLAAKAVFIADSNNANIPPSAMHGPNPPSSFKLVYVGAFNKGLTGLISTKDITALLEAATRAEERGLMHTLINEVAVELQTELSQQLQHPVSVEFGWDTIYPHHLSASQRHDAALTLGGNKSKNVLRPMINGFKDVFRTNPEAIKSMQFLHRIIINSSEDASRPTLEITQDGGSGQQALVYTAGLLQGLSGCFDKHRFKQQVRMLYGLQTPKEDRGIGGALQSVAGGLDRAGDKLGRAFRKFGF
ncbi:hypothetical protein PTSG_11553 [Salpingoeca rosetta]|uniref:Uncharacterized protein n=1 Tax=Salpingoeca rosetta (strain ATCC 50818 / BSB-021) TaxID=946362 RepID=F2TVP2_SALR5|nr:uncharacterized protein PTSG_11553 [Salpingoeca rosetta]EGD72138.1 hypothetical protein PTSG_11553 [Salpingoeca rosetta]|eukprot:XP_004998710.1 hypothetical protein PTSG_11553 [Salpingoeca rosetta]